ESLGRPEVPEAGDVIRAVPDEKAAKALVAQNARERAGSATAERPATLDEMFAQVKEGKAKELKLVLKADVQGSLEAIKGALAKIAGGGWAPGHPRRRRRHHRVRPDARRRIERRRDRLQHEDG